MNAIIRTQVLTKLYGKTIGVKELTLEVGEGEVFGFLGPNGAGKTTVIRLLTGFLRPTSGTATIYGKDVWRESVEVRRDLGFLPDFPALYEGFTGREFLTYMAQLQRREPVLQKKLTSQMELSDRDLGRKIKGYSRGMRQKLALIQAFQHGPSLLILDEPTEGLDPLMQQTFFAIIKEFQSRGHTIFFSSHILPEVEKMCSRVGIIRGGSLVAVEEVELLRAKTVRQMEVSLDGDHQELDLDLPCVLSVEKNGASLKLSVRGDINPLIRELAKVQVKEMVFGAASLEDVFLEFYQPKKENSH